MKFLRFDLRAFGNFKNCLLECDPNVGLQVFYGPNEAGKTTLTRAFLALLFGIDKKSQDDYLFERESLCLEALLETDKGKFIQIHRQHKLSKKLNLELNQFFPSLEKNIFSKNFILNSSTIQTGSRELLQNLNHFDLTLFSHSLGQSKIKSLLKSLVSENDLLFKPKGVKPKINHLITEYTNLHKEQQLQKLSYKEFLDLSEREKLLDKKKAQLEEDLNQLIQVQRCLTTLTTLFNQVNIFKQTNLEIQNLNKKINSESSQLNNVKPEKVNAHKDSIFKLINLHQVELLHLNSLKLEINKINDEIKKNKLKLRSDLNSENIKTELENRNILKDQINIQCKAKIYNQEINTLNEDILTDLVSLGLEELLFDEVLKLTLPNKSKLIQLTDLEYDIKRNFSEYTTQSKRLSDKKASLESKFSDIKLKINFNYEDYQKVRESRLILGETIQRDWGKRKSNENLELFKQYSILVQREELFTHLLIKETDAFIGYKNLQQQLEDLERDLEDLDIFKAENDLKIKERGLLLKDLQQPLFKKELSAAELNCLYEKLPNLCENIKILEQKKLEHIEIMSNLENTRDFLLKKLDLPKSSKFQVGDLFAKYENKIAELKNEYEQNEKFGNLVRLQSELLKDKELQINEKLKKLKEIEKKWQPLALNLGLSLSLNSEEITQYFNKIESYSNLLIQQNSLNKLLEEVSSFKFFEIYNEFKDLKVLMDFSSEAYEAIHLFKNQNISPSELYPFIDWALELNVVLNRISEKEKFLRDQLSELDHERGVVNFQQCSLNRSDAKKSLEVKVQDNLFQIEGSVKSYLKNEMTLYLIHKVIKDYQNQYHDPILELASSIFCELTESKYTKILLNIFDLDSFLICKSSEGDVAIDALSQGTRDQLFLALKLAFIQTYLGRNESLPIVLDDVLVQFDDARASSALKCIEKLSKSSQVFFLTHHEHVLDLLKSNSIDYQLHRLPSSGSKVVVEQR